MIYPSTPDRPPDSLPFDTAGMEPLPAKWSAPAADAPLSGLWEELKDVKIGCAMTACDRDLHCFRLTKKLATSLAPGSCRECRKIYVSMRRTGTRDLADLDYTFAALQREMVRHHFWHVPFGEKALRYAMRKGPAGLRVRVPAQLRSRIGRAAPFRDGQQTPMASDRANPIDLGMHAVAACCRRCAEYWHGIPVRTELTADQIDYLSALVLRFLEARLSGLDGWPASDRTGESGEADVHELRPHVIVTSVSPTLRAS